MRNLEGCENILNEERGEGLQMVGIASSQKHVQIKTGTVYNKMSMVIVSGSLQSAGFCFLCTFL